MFVTVAVLFATRIAATLAQRTSGHVSVSFNETVGVSTINITHCCLNAQDATAFALIYGSPLIAYTNYSLPFFEGGIGTNSLQRSTGLAGPSSTSVHHPNPDVITANAVIDLSQQDLVLTVPQFNDSRFWSFGFYDPYGSNYATLSVELHNGPGQYLIRRAEDVMEPWGYIPADNDSAPYRGYINSPSTQGVLLTRILALNDTSDIPVAVRYGIETKLDVIPRQPQDPFLLPAPTLTDATLKANGSYPLRVMSLLSRLGYYNQPIVGAERYRVGSIIGQSGINFLNASYTSEANISLATLVGLKTVAAQQGVHKNLTNGWSFQDPVNAGIFYADYSERAGAAYAGYLGSTANININPSNKAYPLAILPDEQAYLLTFYGPVPVVPEYGGFWSVTAYNGDGNLVNNTIDRYTLGNRDHLTYSDGTPVFKVGPDNGTAIGTVAASSGTRQFQLLLQNSPPPSNWTSNWLPMPPATEQSFFKMRVYAPANASINGSYQYPSIQKISAIT